jgi:xanthine dehydrogenase YagT iron-sulfur-binding subunit
MGESAEARQQGHALSSRAATPQASIILHINGQGYALSVDPRTSLLDAIRDQADRYQEGLWSRPVWGLHGARGRTAVLACLTLALMSEGRKITTIEGLSTPGNALHPMHQAFIDHGRAGSAGRRKGRKACHKVRLRIALGL